jgi:hypothetical protein
MGCAGELAALLEMSTPFEDTQKRFHLDLPKGWFFNPQPGHAESVAFARQSEGVFGGAVVVVAAVPSDTTLESYGASVLNLYAQEPGFKLLEKKQCLLGMLPAQCQRYVMQVPGGKGLVKMVYERITLGPKGAAYILHMESVAEAYPLLEKDFNHLGESFRFGAQQWGAAPQAVAPMVLAGTWRSAEHTWVFSPRGTVLWNKTSGTYQAKGGVLKCVFDNGKKTVFSYSLEGSTLVLRGERFSSGLVLTRSTEEPSLEPVLP